MDLNPPRYVNEWKRKLRGLNFSLKETRTNLERKTYKYVIFYMLKICWLILDFCIYSIEKDMSLTDLFLYAK